MALNKNVCSSRNGFYKFCISLEHFPVNKIYDILLIRTWSEIKKEYVSVIFGYSRILPKTSFYVSIFTIFISNYFEFITFQVTCLYLSFSIWETLYIIPRIPKIQNCYYMYCSINYSYLMLAVIFIQVGVYYVTCITTTQILRLQSKSKINIPTLFSKLLAGTPSNKSCSFILGNGTK